MIEQRDNIRRQMGSRLIFGARVTASKNERMTLLFELIRQLDKLYSVKQFMFPQTIIVNGQLRHLYKISHGNAQYKALIPEVQPVQSKRCYPWVYEFDWLNDYFAMEQNLGD